MAGIPSTRVEGGVGAPTFDQALVEDAMRPGVITCPPETALRAVAHMMATHRVHAIVVTGGEGADEWPWTVITDTDLAGAAGTGFEGLDAGALARSGIARVGANEPLQDAARLMSEQGVSHLLVVAPVSDRPVGVLSTLDLAAVLAQRGHPLPTDR